MNLKDKQRNMEAIKRLDSKTVARDTKKQTERLLAVTVGMLVIATIVCCKYIDYVCGLLI